MSNLTVVLPCLLSGSEISVNMAVTDNLDHDALLGRNFRNIRELIHQATAADPQDILDVQTRAQTQTEAQQDLADQDDQDQDGLEPNPLEDLLGPDYNFPRTNMSHQTDPDSDTDSSGEADMQQNNAANLIQDQRADETLKELWKSANKEDSPFMTNKGVLMRKTKDKLGEPYTQVIVPQSRRLEVLKLAHSAPAAGHTGAHRTKFKVLKNFFWPGIGKETTQFCRSCERCQRTAKRTNNHAPLTITNPPICRPFQKVAIDIVGPLPLTLGKNQFILSYIDVGSRYPEAIPLKKTTAIEVGKALMNIMSRLSVPEEFLSDRGSNFLSAVLKEAFKFLGVHHSKTAPYHPQSNGAVERFHHTLFQMIRSSSQEGQHWDELLPCLLFACREAPCSTTGFSPFELVFGKHVRGPLDILRQSWTPNSRSPQLATDWLLKLRDDLHKMRKLAADQQATTQERTKRWHDQTAKTITFSPGDLVLVFTPVITGSKASKLQDRWEGPFEVLEQVSPVTYHVDTQDRRKKIRTVHVTAMKVWLPPVYDIACLSVEHTECPDLPDYHSDENHPFPEGQDHLSQEQLRFFKRLWDDFPTVTCAKPGRTQTAKHHIRVRNASPVHLRPYAIPHSRRDAFKKELQKLTEEGFIEPSYAPWAAPIFPVPKKTPGKIRLVCDYRRLNAVTTPDPYFQPRIEEALEKLAAASLYTILDLASGFYQVPIAPEDKDKTTVISPYGKFRFKVMPFGLRNAPATFQRMMDGLLINHNDYTFVCIDDGAVFSNSWDEHKYHLITVFDVLRNAGLTIQAAKAQLATTSCVFLGHRVGGGYISPYEAKISTVRDFIQPRSKKDVRASSDSLTIIEDSSPTSRPYLHHSQISYSSTNLILWIGLKIVRQPLLLQSRPYALPLC